MLLLRLAACSNIAKFCGRLLKILFKISSLGSSSTSVLRSLLTDSGWATSERRGAWSIRESRGRCSSRVIGKKGDLY